MNDLMQLNDNDAALQVKMASVCPIAQMPAKRSTLKSKAHHLNEPSNDTGKSSPPNSHNMLHVNHKRPSTLDTSISKRLKSNSTVSSYSFNSSNSTSMQNIQQRSYLLQNQQPSTPQMTSAQLINQQEQQKSPHLLQHLMAPTPTRVRKCNDPSKNLENINSNGQWNRVNGALKQESLQSSDSVLKNLLVSGCDISAGYVCQVPIRMKKLAKA